MTGQATRARPFGWVAVIEADGKRELRWGQAPTKADAMQAVGELRPHNGIGGLYSGHVEAERVSLADVAGTLARAGSLLGSLTIGHGLQGERA